MAEHHRGVMDLITTAAVSEEEVTRGEIIARGAELTNATSTATVRADTAVTTNTATDAGARKILPQTISRRYCRGRIHTLTTFQ